MPDDESDPTDPGEGWETNLGEYRVDVTLPDGSKITESADPSKEGPTRSTLRDRDGNIIDSWDSDSDLDADEELFPPRDPDAPPDDKGFFDKILPHKTSTAPEPRLQRYWRLKREGKDPGPDPRVGADSGDPEEIVIAGDDQQFDDAISWFRKGPIRLPLLAAIGGIVILVGWFLLSQDDEAVQIEAVGEPRAEQPIIEEPPADEQPAEDTPAAETPEEDDVPQVSTRIPVGATDIVGLVDSPCGGLYSVFLLARVFGNQEVTVDQLDSANGNPFQTARGWSNSRISMVTGGDGSFYEVWFFIWNLGEILNVYNVYGSTADFVAPESIADLERFGSVNSSEDLLAAVNGSADSCATEVSIETTASADLLGTDS
jgi:hypothetical protein